jgi:NAD(P)-dependent dehydrogenase (short-subunit alcohol dehydrogenase family)
MSLNSNCPRTALVIGANRGIGLALCHRLTAQGRTVIAACRRSSPALDAEAARGVRVETGVDAILHPGYVRTEMTGGHGNVPPETAAAQLVDRIDALVPAASGTFWHANGQVLPW